MYGFATFESKELMPLPIVLTRKIAIKMDELTSKIPELFGSDGKCQVSIAYDENDNPVKVTTIIVSQQTQLNVDREFYTSFIIEECLKKIDELDDKDKTEQEIIVNKDGDKLKITKEENLKIFKLIKEQYSKSIYNSITYIVKSRDILEDSFNNLSIKKQIDTLFNMIKILSRSNEDAKFDESLKNGGIKYYRISMNIDNNQIYIVNESPSGLFKGKEELI